MTEPVNTDASPKANLRATRILCVALVTGASVFAAIVILLNQVMGSTMKGVDENTKRLFTGVVGVVALISIVTALSRYKKGIQAVKNSTAPLNERLNQYRAVMIQYMALCEGVALFSIMIFFVTGDFIVLGILAVMLLLMLWRMPQKTKISHELGLNFQEQQELE